MEKDKKTPEQIIDSYEKAVTEDSIGLWEVFADARWDVEANEGKTTQAVTLDLVGRMLSRGFRAGYMADNERGFEAWPDQNPNSVIRRIEAEWNELGRDPTISDICWFDRD